MVVHPPDWKSLKTLTAVFMKSWLQNRKKALMSAQRRAGYTSEQRECRQVSKKQPSHQAEKIMKTTSKY